jgi:hypothetical protein
MASADPLTRLASLATLSPRGARGLSRVTREFVDFFALSLGERVARIASRVRDHGSLTVPASLLYGSVHEINCPNN